MPLKLLTRNIHIFIYFFFCYIVFSCIRGHLKDKAVILVTHQLHFLKKVDTVIVLHKGEIAEIGSFKELMSDSKGRLYMLLEERKTESNDIVEAGSSEDASTVSIKSEVMEKLHQSCDWIEDKHYDSNR